MKKLITFLLGIVVGFFLAYYLDEDKKNISLKSIFQNNSTETILTEPTTPEYNPPKVTNKNITIFDQPGDRIDAETFEVREVLSDGCALVKQDNFPYDLEALFLNDNGQTYYDQQRIKPTSGKCFRQIGLYKYTKYGKTKTIPVVAIMEK